MPVNLRSTNRTATSGPTQSPHQGVLPRPLTFLDRINSVAVGPGALWVATGSAGTLERFDIRS
jgi:hypothetical protein